MAHFSVSVKGGRSLLGVFERPGVDADATGNDTVLVRSPFLVQESSRLPLDTKPSCNAPREILRSGDPRIGVFTESGEK